MPNNALLLKVTQEPTYLLYLPIKLVIRSDPGLDQVFYAKIENGKEYLITVSMEIMKSAIRECIEISKAEYDAF